MAYSEYLADRVRERLRNRAHQEKAMMGGLIFMVNEALDFWVDKALEFNALLTSG